MAQPDLIITPFADNAPAGSVDTIPETLPSGSSPERVSWEQGFPAVTMTPLAAGGIPPRGQSFNGVLKAISEHTVFLGHGGNYKWSQDYVTDSGGYSIGDVVQANDGLNSYVSLVNNNTANFNTTPASIGTSWSLYSGVKTKEQATETVSGVAEIATQAEVTTGTDDARIVSPAKLRGAQATQAEAEAGTNNTKIMTPLRSKQLLDKNSTGRLAATPQFLTSSGTVTKTTGARLWRVRLWGAGAQGGGVQATSSTQVAAGGGGSAGAYAEAWFDVSAITSAPLVIGVAGTTGAAGQNGAPGGSSSLTMGSNSLTCPGGLGGGVGTAQSSLPNEGGTAGLLSANPSHVGAISFVGVAGGGATTGIVLSTASAQPGIGGVSTFGTTRASGSPGNSSGYASGGSGQRSLISTSANNGAFGSPGLCIIEEYF